MITKRNDFDNIEAYKLLNEQTGEFVEIITGFGAIINKFMLANNNSLNSVIEGYDNRDDLLTNYQKTFKGAKLFPYANRIKNGKYIFDGKQYELNINFPQENNSIHGLLLDKKFNVVSIISDDSKAELEIEFNYNGTEPGFPFNFNIRINYVLTKENNLILETAVKNVGEKSFPMGDGWHPYFTLGGNIDDVQLELKSSHILEVDDSLIPTGNLFEYKDFTKLKRIADSNFDTCFRLQSNEEIIKTILFNPLNNTELEIWQETGEDKYKYAQVFIPPSRKTIAVEPMTSPPNAFNSQKDVIVLEPGKIINLKCGIKAIAKK